MKHETERNLLLIDNEQQLLLETRDDVGGDGQYDVRLNAKIEEKEDDNQHSWGEIIKFPWSCTSLLCRRQRLRVHGYERLTV